MYRNRKVKTEKPNLQSRIGIRFRCSLPPQQGDLASLGSWMRSEYHDSKTTIPTLPNTYSMVRHKNQYRIVQCRVTHYLRTYGTLY
jgi:hypothetical protein